MALGDALIRINEFLRVPTPDAWVAEAVDRLPDLLNDHANCELKAASTALGFIYRYPERTDICARMSRLAREELRHFEQVRKLMQEMALPFERLSASRYAGSLRDQMRHDEPERRLDTLLIGAIIEARSCERFAVLGPHLPEPLKRFYAGLLASEARHFENYLGFANSDGEADEAAIETRLNELLTIEAALIAEPDEQFRFHSGRPAANP